MGSIYWPLPVTTTHKRYIIVATEYLTKWPEAHALEKADAESVANFIFEELICHHGAPKEILSDQGSHFCNKLVDTLCKKMTIVHHTSTAYYPQTNRLVERFNKTLCGVLNKCINQFDKEWHECVTPALFAYRTISHHTTGYELFYLLYGQSATLPIKIGLTLYQTHPRTKEDLQALLLRRVENLLGELIAAQQFAAKKIKKMQDKQKGHYEKKIKIESYENGNQVLLYKSVVQYKIRT